MQIISSNHGYYFEQYGRIYPPEFHDRTGYAEVRMNLLDEVSRGELSEICFEGVRIHTARLHTQRADVIQTTEDFASVEMMFQLRGQTMAESSIRPGLQPGQHNLNCRPPADVRNRLATGHHHYVGIQLTETFFQRFADDNSPALARMMNCLARREAALLSPQNLTVGPALRMQLTSLSGQNGSQPLKRLCLEMMVLDLLRQQIEQAVRQPEETTTLKATDVEKVLAVKTLLETNPLGSYSLLYLSRFVGLNDYKLKRGFREVVGTTVFGYLNELRMQYARQLLCDTNRTVGSVADELGYSETHHFSTAFKRKFGYLPGQIARLVSA